MRCCFSSGMMRDQPDPHPQPFSLTPQTARGLRGRREHIPSPSQGEGQGEGE